MVHKKRKSRAPRFRPGRETFSSALAAVEGFTRFYSGFANPGLYPGLHRVLSNAETFDVSRVPTGVALMDWL